jgi:hypothetical protein
LSHVLAEEQILQQIERLIDSEPFRSSEVQRRLLKYLAEKSLAGEAQELKEYTIGIEGIGRPTSYDPRRDSTVRLQVSKLRQKIAEYYLAAGQEDPVLIDLPKGHFKLVFSTREQPKAVSVGRSRTKWRALTAALAGGLLLSAALCTWLAISLSHLKSISATASLPPSLEEFWGPLAASSKPTLVCLGTPMFVKLGSTGIFRNSDINAWDAAQSSGLVTRLQRLFPGAKLEPWYVFTTLGEAGGAFMLGKTLSSRMPNLQLAHSTELSWEQIREDNVVFVGPNRFNLQISALPVQQDFAMESSGIRNLRRRAGEPAFFEDVAGENQSGLAYALISRLPGLHGDGNIIVLAGAGIPGTLAATEFVTTEAYAAEMLRRIRPAGGGLPRYYQIVISCKFNQWVPVEINYVIHHVLTPA